MQFSVLMSLYYKETPSNLNECLESLFNQTRFIPEIICVYDGPVSKELDEVVIRWSALLPLKTIKLVKNIGLGNALNEGLKYCSFDFVARMDTDDICEKNRFEQQLAYLEKYPQTVILGSNTQEFESDPNTITSSRIVPLSHKDIIQYAKVKNPFNHMSVIFNKHVIFAAGGYRHHYLMEDYNLWLRVLSITNNVANLQQFLVKVRAGNDMVARRSGLNYIKSEYQLAQLKYELKFQTLVNATGCFLLRSLPRLLPMPVLKYIYVKSRKNKN